MLDSETPRQLKSKAVLGAAQYSEVLAQLYSIIAEIINIALFIDGFD